MNFIGTGQDSIYIALEKGEAESSSYRLPIDSSPGSFILDPSVNQTSPMITGGAPVPLVQCSLVSIVTLYIWVRN